MIYIYIYIYIYILWFKCYVQMMSGLVPSTSSQTQHQMEGIFLRDVVVGEGSAVFKLLSRKDEALLIGRDAFLVLNLLLDALDGV